MFNKVILIGRLTADPELKQTQSGVSVCSFTIAVDRKYTGSNGERTADFINIVAWRGTADFVCKWFQKGTPIGIEGSIQTRKYEDKNGNPRTAVEVVADQVFFVGGKKDGQQAAAPTKNAPQSTASPSTNQQPNQPQTGSYEQQTMQQASSYSSGSFNDFQEYEGEEDLPF